MVIAVDGFSAYVGSIRRAFRSPLPKHGQPGRPKLIPGPILPLFRWSNSAHKAPSLSPVASYRAVRIPSTASERVHKAFLASSTSYIKRLNATFRQRLHWLTRRSRSLALKPQTLVSGMYIVGSLYNFCDFHHSLKVKIWIGERQIRWIHRTPAMAAGITDHQWSVHELLTFPSPPPKWKPPKSRGRPSKHMLQLIQKWAS